MQLNDLLKLESIDPQTVLVMRHRPFEPKLQEVLPWLAVQKPTLFNAYQQTQVSQTAENALKRATFLASFIGHEPGKAIFVGLFRRGETQPLSYDQFWHKAEYIQLKEFGIRGFPGDRDAILWFDLTKTDIYANWMGKLIISWPGGERSWWRWADRNEFLVEAIIEESGLVQKLQDWRELTLSWAALQVLPASWQAALAQWRGIYYILDESDGRGYVGSAYGNQNILGRWLNYSATGHGGNAELKRRNPANFHFSILERVSPDMSSEDVLRLEANWKGRLHSRRFGLNEN
jgi:hypothetical protein